MPSDPLALAYSTPYKASSKSPPSPQSTANVRQSTAKVKQSTTKVKQSTTKVKQSTAKVKRKRIKRDGHLQLQFVTATDPSQFRHDNVKRSVRSQAMIHWRHEDSMQKKRNQESPAKTPTPDQSAVVEKATTCTKSQGPHEHTPPTHSVPSPDLCNNNVAQHVDYSLSDADEELQIQVLIEKLASCDYIGPDFDPCSLLPQFQNLEPNITYLVRECVEGFTTASVHKKWTPSHPHIILSSAQLASTWIDMHSGCLGDSKRTATIKAETFKIANERLRNPETRLEDTTLMVIVSLLAGEMWSCNEMTLHMHQTAVGQFVMQRDGMDCLGGNGAIAEVTAGCCYHYDIVCETDPPLPLQSWEPPALTPMDLTDIPESPLFCLDHGFLTVEKTMHCLPLTYKLLCDMRDLTNLFISHNTMLDSAQPQQVGLKTNPNSSSLEYDRKVADILERVASLPSASTQGLPTSNDWVYESCRIAALIYTAAIVMRVPFSIAADPARNVALCHAGPQVNSKAAEHVIANNLAGTLYEVLKLSDTTNLWDGMSGVFYWVCTIGATAARTPSTIDMTRQPKLQNEGYAMWVRRCLIMFSTRAMTVLVFQHPIPVITAQKRLLKIQELISSSNASKSFD